MGLVARYATALLGSVALGVLSAGAAHAQQAQTTNTKYVTLLERLVIGSGKAKIAIDTPQAVTVLEQEDIDQQQANSVGELFDDIPGVTMVGSERVMGETFSIRGIGSSDSPTSSGDANKIIISVDGAPKFYEQYRMGSFFSDTELYKSVEVLRGPASSTLYGSGAIGGVINFTTKDAADLIKDGYNGSLQVKGQYSSNGNGTLTSAVLAQRINETFDILAAGNFRRSGTVQLANGGDMLGSQFDAWSGLVKGTARFGENDEQVLRASYQRWQSDVDKTLYNQTGFIDPTLGGFGTIDRNVIDQTFVLAYENPDSANPLIDVKVNLSYSDTAVEQRNPSATLGTIGAADYGYKTYQATVENTSEFSGDDWENYLTIGGSLAQQQRNGTPLAGGIISTHPAGTQTKAGIFAQNEYIWDDRATIIAGVRADFIDLDPSPLLVGTAPRSDIALSPKLAALYKLSDSLNVFGSIAHTERVASLDEMFQYNTTRTPSLQLKKERADNFEIGFSTQAYDVAGLSNTASFKATAFYNDIKDGIRLNPQTGNLPYFANVSNMRIWGIELEGAYESEELFGRLAYTLTRGEYANPIGTIPAGSPIDTLAQDRVVVTLGARAFERQLEYGTKITAAAPPIYQLAASTGANGPSTGWTKVDLFASWKPIDGDYQVAASVENLLNTDYRENLSLERSSGRTFKLTLAKQFDY